MDFSSLILYCMDTSVNPCNDTREGSQTVPRAFETGRLKCKVYVISKEKKETLHGEGPSGRGIVLIARYQVKSFTSDKINRCVNCDFRLSDSWPHHLTTLSLLTLCQPLREAGHTGSTPAARLSDEQKKKRLTGARLLPRATGCY